MLQKSIKKFSKEIDSLLTSLKQANNDNIRSLILNEIDKLQTQQKDLENQLLLEEANNMPINASQIRFYLTELKKWNINDVSYCRLLIDTFIYKIYLYDDKMIITYTTQDEKSVQFSTNDELSSTFDGAIAPSNETQAYNFLYFKGGFAVYIKLN